MQSICCIDMRWCVAQDEEKIQEKELAVLRKRSLSNICFIGELFRLQMLSEAIMNECVTQLLKSTSNEKKLECCCKLLTVIGKSSDTQTAMVGVAGTSQD